LVVRVLAGGEWHTALSCSSASEPNHTGLRCELDGARFVAMSSTKLIYAIDYENGEVLGTWHGNIISADGLILTVAHAIIIAQSKAIHVIFRVADRPGVMLHEAELITPPDWLRCRPDLAILKIRRVSADQLQVFAYCALARASTLTGVTFTEGYTDICQRYHESAGRVYAARGLVKSDELALTFGDSGKPLFNHLGQLVAIASYRQGWPPRRATGRWPRASPRSTSAPPRLRSRCRSPSRPSGTWPRSPWSRS